MYKNKYLKYKKKYLNLVNQIGGECEPPPDPDDIDPIGQPLVTPDITPDDRITINGKCYNINDLYTWILSFPLYDVGQWRGQTAPSQICGIIQPKMEDEIRSPIQPLDFERIVQHFALNVGPPFVTDEHINYLELCIGTRDPHAILRELMTRARRISLQGSQDDILSRQYFITNSILHIRSLPSENTGLSVELIDMLRRQASEMIYTSRIRHKIYCYGRQITRYQGSPRSPNPWDQPLDVQLPASIQSQPLQPPRSPNPWDQPLDVQLPASIQSQPLQPRSPNP